MLYSSAQHCTLWYCTALYGTVLHFMVLYCTVQHNILTKISQNHFKVTIYQLEEGGRLEPIVSSVQKVKMSGCQEVPELPKAKGAKDARV